MGPRSVRVATYFPFNVTCYLNGHSFVAQDLTRAGIRFRKADNAFVGVADADALQAAANRLSAAILERRCAYWIRRLVAVFNPSAFRAVAPRDRYSMARMGAAPHALFNRSAPMHGV